MILIYLVTKNSKAICLTLTKQTASLNPVKAPETIISTVHIWFQTPLFNDSSRPLDHSIGTLAIHSKTEVINIKAFAQIHQITPETLASDVTSATKKATSGQIVVHAYDNIIVATLQQYHPPTDLATNNIETTIDPTIWEIDNEVITILPIRIETAPPPAHPIN